MSNKAESNWEVYVIQTDDGKLYTGITSDLARRFDEHQSHKKGARFFHFPEAKKVLFRESHPNRSEASKREMAIKKLTRKEKLELITKTSR